MASHVALVSKAKVSFLADIARAIAHGKDNVWKAVVHFRRGNRKGSVFSRPTLALVDKQGQRIETADGVKLRWTESLSAVEAGSCIDVQTVVDQVLAGEVWEACGL